MNRMLRVGVVGGRRGLTLARECQMGGMEVVAICDLDRARLNSASSALGAVPYQDYDAFLAHDMEGVILANFFDAHAPLALKALKAGKHVMSETAACKTVAEGVQLQRTVEQTGGVYLFAANYPFKPHARELRRLYQAGEVGTFQYGECEYLHGFSPDYLTHFGQEPRHWRSRVSSLAYCTHSITPVMYVTDTLPTEVSAFVIPSDSSPESLDAARRGRGTRGGSGCARRNGRRNQDRSRTRCVIRCGIAATMHSSARASLVPFKPVSLPTSMSTGASSPPLSVSAVCGPCSAAPSLSPFLIFAKRTSATSTSLTTGTASKDHQSNRMCSWLGRLICFTIP